MRKEVVFAMEQFALSERRACKLVGLERSTIATNRVRIITRSFARSW
jgi:hypothetical protein